MVWVGRYLKDHLVPTSLPGWPPHYTDYSVPRFSFYCKAYVKNFTDFHCSGGSDSYTKVLGAPNMLCHFPYPCSAVLRSAEYMSLTCLIHKYLCEGFSKEVDLHRCCWKNLWIPGRVVMKCQIKGIKPDLLNNPCWCKSSKRDTFQFMLSTFDLKVSELYKILICYRVFFP